MVMTPGTYQGTFGELTLNQDGTYTYSPYDPATNPATLQALNTPGVHQDVFEYRVDNASGAETSSTLTINILTDPQANPDTNSYTEGSGTPVTGNVITNDSTNSGGNLMVVTPGTYQGTFGELTLNQDGTYTYSPYDPATNPSILQALNTPGADQDVFDYTDKNASGAETSSTLTIDIHTKPPVPEPNSYTFTTGVVGFVDGSPNENGYFEYNLNGINILTDPAPGSNLKDYDPQNESISVYQITNATLTVAGENVALTPSTLFSSDPTVVGEYDFTYQGASATIVEYNNGAIKIFSQDNGVFPYVDVGQQVVFKGDYSLINQDGIISTTTAPFTITLDGTNIPIAYSDTYQVNEDQLSSNTYTFTTTILNNDSDNNPYVDQALVIDHVFDGQTPYKPGTDYIPSGPSLVLYISGEYQTIELTQVTTPTTNPNAVAEYTASFGNPGDPNYTTYTFDITADGHVEVTRQGVDILRSGQALYFQATYNIFGANNQNEAAASYPAYISVEIDGVTKPPVPEPNSYEFDTNILFAGDISGTGDTTLEGYYQYNLNNINILTDPASDTGQVDYDPQNESISVYQISNATLTVAGENVALTPSTLLSNDPNVVGEYDFTYQGASATIVEYKNGDIKIFSQDNGVFPFVDVGQQVIFKGDYSLINQDGIISTTTAPFTITLDGTNVPISYTDAYYVNQAQLALSTYKFTPTILDNDDDNNPYADQPLVIKTVFDGQTIFTNPVYGNSYTPNAPTLFLSTINQPDQTIQLIHVTTPTVDPNAITEYKATFGNPGDPNYTTLTFDITANGDVEVTKQGINILLPDQSLAFYGFYNIAIADNQAAISDPTYIVVNIGSGLFTPTAEPNDYTFNANDITLTGNSMATNFNNINIITDNDIVHGKDSDILNETLIVDEITNFKVTLPDGTVKTVQGILDPGDPITISGLGTFRVNMNGTVSFTPNNPNEFNMIEKGQALKISFNYTNENTDNVESSSVAVNITINGTNYAPVIEETRFGNSPQFINGPLNQSQQANSNHINVDFTDQDGTKLSHVTIKELSTGTNNVYYDHFELSNFTVSSTVDPEGYRQITTSGYTNLYIKGLGTSYFSSGSLIKVDIKGLDTHDHYQDVVNNLHLNPYGGSGIDSSATGTRELSLQITDENGLSSNVDTTPYIVTNPTPINIKQLLLNLDIVS